MDCEQSGLEVGKVKLTAQKRLEQHLSLEINGESNLRYRIPQLPYGCPVRSSSLSIPLTPIDRKSFDTLILELQDPQIITY